MSLKKSAEMTIFGALISFAMIMILCPVFEFVQISKRADVTEQSIRSALIDTCTADSIVRYNDVKYEYAENYKLDTDKYISSIFHSLGYVQNGAGWTKGSTSITDITLTFAGTTNTFELRYKLNTPYKVLNKAIKDVAVEKQNIVQWDYVA